MRAFRLIRSVVLAGSMAAAMSFTIGSAAAHASGGGYSSGAVYQITWSLNCDNRSAACASDPNIGLGGFWGWVALLPADAHGVQADNGQETVCGHPGGGALHQSFDSTWVSFSSSMPPGPVTDPNGKYILIQDPFGLFPVPATMGHYSVSFEGAKGQIQVSP
jgi:hypothetical protein